MAGSWKIISRIVSVPAPACREGYAAVVEFTLADGRVICNMPGLVPKLDANGAPVVDERGKPVMIPALGDLYDGYRGGKYIEIAAGGGVSAIAAELDKYLAEEERINAPFPALEVPPEIAALFARK